MFAEEDIEQRIACLRLFESEYGEAKRKEREGLAVLVSMDESFCNERHYSLYTYLPTNGDEEPIADVPAPKGQGRRLCMVGGISIYGHIITHFPDGHAKAGQPVIDCEWRKDGHSVECDGSFVELDNNGDPRLLFGGNYPMDYIAKMNELELGNVIEEMHLKMTDDPDWHSYNETKLRGAVIKKSLQECIAKAEETANQEVA